MGRAMTNQVNEIMTAWTRGEARVIGKLKTDGQHVYYHDTCLLAWNDVLTTVVLNRTQYTSATKRVQNDIEAWLRNPATWHADFDKGVQQASIGLPYGVTADRLLEAAYERVTVVLYETPKSPKPLEKIVVAKSPSIYQYNPEVGF